MSDVALDEIADAPLRVQDFALSISSKNIERVSLEEESRELALRYIEEKVVGETSLADCFHIAIATLNKADLLVSWNFKHIVNVNKIRGYNGVILICGYPILEIRTQGRLLNMKTKIKTYDCVKEVRKSRERISEELKGKSAKEILEYFKTRREKKRKCIFDRIYK